MIPGNIMLKNPSTCLRVFTRSYYYNIKKWRRDNKKPENHMNHGPLTDLPDYSFTDGRQTPYGSMQYTRLQEQKLIASQILEMAKQMEYAKTRFQRIKAEEKEQREKYLSKKLLEKNKEYLGTTAAPDTASEESENSRH